MKTVEQLGEIKPLNLGINQDLFQNLSYEWVLAIKFLHKTTLLAYRSLAKNGGHAVHGTWDLIKWQINLHEF